MHTRCSRTILKTLFSWGTSVTERIRLFSGTVAAVAEGKEREKCNGSLSSMLPQIIKAFVCLDILASLCTGFCTASTSMICWWYDQLKVWKARLMCKRWSGLGKSCFFLVDAKEGVKSYLIKHTTIQKFGVIHLYFLFCKCAFNWSKNESNNFYTKNANVNKCYSESLIKIKLIKNSWKMKHCFHKQ